MKAFAYLRSKVTSIGYSLILPASKMIDSFNQSTDMIASHIRLTSKGSSSMNAFKNSTDSLILQF